MFAVLAAGTAAFLFLLALIMFQGFFDERAAVQVVLGGLLALSLSVLAHVNARHN